MSDRLPVCEICINFPGEYNFCPITARCCREDYLYESCSDFEQKRNTVFRKITTSPEVLAPYFVEKQPDKWDDDDYPYYSYLTKEWYATEDKAIAATVAKLKEVGE